MVKIVNGIIQAEDSSVEPSEPDDGSYIVLFGFKLRKWMIIAIIAASLFLFGLKGMLLVSGGLFIAYTVGSGSSPTSTLTQQVSSYAFTL